MRNLIVLVAAVAIVVASSLAFAPAVRAAAPPDGKALFSAKCSACHQATGLGNGPYPPLAGNPDVNNPDTSGLIATVLNGRSGPITILGHTYSGTMPAWRGQLANAEIAAVLTYVRSAWTNKAAAVSEDQVAAANQPIAVSGADLFVAKCATCHQANGQGTAAYPPLAGNPDVTATDPKSMIATVVNGRSGPLVVAGTTFNGKMPTWKGQLSNADIAAVVTYVRGAWSNKASGVTEQQVASSGPAVSSTVGMSVFANKCAACHQASGKGGAGGLYPALAGNADVNAPDPTRILSTIEHGKNIMPSWKGQLSPADLAAVATYIRSAWGNKGGPVSEGDVAAIK
ncbi:MAG: c-type cytochrome [Candidatus Lustribacter sp.]|jgi:cbb3-type cytochrome c oxidase subunit III